MYNNICTRCRKQFVTEHRRNYLCKKCRSIYDRLKYELRKQKGKVKPMTA